MRDTIGNEKWKTVTALGNATSLVYVVDTTGSMYHEIKGGQEIAKNVIEKTRNVKLDFILSPFNDPGRFTYVTFYRKRSTFQND